ncbi:type IV pili twitching motility protein PilT [Solemya pervernicosa gill symbiont]|uniref:Type IV pili twitching motility protein PilT n=2 Tax=Gammaproteobacteria incertae sedis TaxID=118884 RepID=A0A1T2L3I9_9GAMM|nr:PilT/PilU family type 4a pilus ATPase [Candidatus Reidiella endopervernicosa]OOZ39570.1 type IV pili twitching motility protein PilT [Solemya pervernicosa gill symbiont]QKQ25656.1 PilT/PilU family type 4a pilus ATPase [Candidatus Reidiella endopervernicosa]
MDITPYLKMMVEQKASDLFLSVGAPAHFKIEGKLVPVREEPQKPDAVKDLAYSVMSGDQIKDFEETLEANLAISLPDIGRFRVNVYRQRGEVTMVARYLVSEIPSIADLGLPSMLEEIITLQRGLVLVVGTTGSGKSTTMASMLDHRNRNTASHIVTIEDPLEYMHGHRKSIVDQREVGFDTLSYESALQNAMREAPDVVMIGEIRKQETMQQAIAYAETGHLCLSSLHAANANQAIDRIINFFPESATRQVLMDLSLNLRAIISQRLVPGSDGKRVVATEVLLNSSHVRELIRNGELHMIKEAMEGGIARGMHTFDQSLYNLFTKGKISKEEALKYADSRTDLALKMNLAGSGGDDSALGGISI